MSTLRIITTEQVVRVTPQGDGPSISLDTSPISVVRVSEVGVQGAPGEQGQKGDPGPQGPAYEPEHVDGGFF